MAAITQDTGDLAQAGSPPAPDRALVEEVRVAMALNGGVSLAVWMGGCAVELDAARRAHLGPETFAHAEDPPPPRTIYHALCRAFHRELVIDLMTGSSAGGINGALLAAAIHRGRRLHADYVREKWIALGDFQKLLRGLRAEAPTSLMDGTTFRDELCTAFEELLPAANQAEEPSKAECLLRIDGEQREYLGDDADALDTAVKLEITATDVLGEEHRFRDEWGEELIAREYRQRFRFRACEDFKPDLLADAARSSASFPLAFEPWRVPGERLELEGDRWLIDGGLLDNAPIQSVLKLIPARASRRKVRRYVCYVNADPPLDPSFLTAAEAREATRSGLRRRNGSEPDGTPEPEAPRSPRLQDVVGYMVNLPRKATFVDHLNAIQRAAGRSLAVEEANTSLLALDRAVLRQSADALLPAYRSRRRLLALGEHFDRRPADIRLADERIREVNGELPWIPQTMEPPAAPGWGWGVRPAQRVLYLLLDLIRHAADHREKTGDDGAARELHDAQQVIYEKIEALEGIHAVVDADPHIGRLVASLADRDDPTPMTLCSLRCRVQGSDRDEAIRTHVRRAAAVVFGLGEVLGEARAGKPEAVDVRAALFGPGDAAGGELPEERFERFLERTLGIEVVRRAFAADDHVDSDQSISFAQITPCAPALLLTARPISAEDAPATPDEKLTGTGWGHFAGFYRRSWRANDFMWGRLDAAVRVVDMLVDAKRAEWVSEHTDVDPAGVLADALWPAVEPADGSADANLAGARRRLIAEVLTEAEPVEPSEAFREGEWRTEQLEQRLALSRAALHDELRGAIAQDLAGAAEPDAPPPALTRALCVRAAQLEVLCHEYGNVVDTSVADLETGTAAKPLEPVAASWEDAIEQLRTDASLPRRLGARDDAERSSALMIRTATRSALVALAAMRETKLPSGAR